MVDRIRALLLARQLSPTQFADAIGVARPIVSHIMSGRNKPSLEVVQKILGAFPDLAMPWLLNGSGPMLSAAGMPIAAKDAPAGAPSVPRKRPIAVPPGPSETNKPAERPLGTASPGLAPSIAEEPVVSAPALPREDFPLPATAPAGAVATSASVPPELALFAEPGKAIRRIVIFYRDGTFADYRPE